MNLNERYILFIVNPKSGASSSKQLVAVFNDYLAAKDYEVRVEFTKSLEHACELATQGAVDYRCGLVAAAGGDGTLRETLHGLEGSDKLFLPVPCGTENLLANELGFDMHAETLIRAFEGDCIRPLDLGTVNGRCFTSIAGFGFDGSVIERISSTRKGHISHMSYFWPIWRTFWEYTFPKIRVEVDNKEIFNDRGLVFIGNISRYAVGLSICKDARYGDGLLDLCIMRCSNQGKLLLHSLRTVFKRHVRNRDVIYRQTPLIRVEAADGPVYCEIDGDPGPELPAEIKVIPQAVKALVPPGAKPAGIRTRLRRMIG
ncbi:MAG: diacylglycerol kinase family lipid kinase [Planctomycetaceae bacterium]|nr:diacylglycerol kinase family lipid kinase [Planctomycetaceae bacterium]